MATKPYLITFRPIDVFFLGNEKTLNDDNLSYFVHSNKYPQQTTLLGALRYKLLEANGLLSHGNKPVDIKAHQWIGNNSFQINSKTNTYGYIEQLSPVFLKEEQNYWHASPKDYSYSFKVLPARVKLADGNENLLGIFEGFDAKAGVSDCLTNIKSKESPKAIDDFFVSDIRNGIQKNDLVETKALFKQSYYRFKSSKMAFAIVAFLDEIAGKCLIDYINKSPFVRMGAEQKSFEMAIAECGNPLEYFQLEHHNSSEFTKIVLLSDTYIEPSIYKYCVGALNETVDFRNIETNSNTQFWNWDTKGKGQNAFPKKLTTKLNLLEKGSVFYLKNGADEAFELALKSNSHFRKIGNNAYLKFLPNLSNPTISIFH
ncbi:type III-B CRISPR module-associated Cmr3 family protein [Arcicella aquatica]|uniref:Type III-B CRISPR module-associated Cmr3 family protein n=1 Tax=Arcicella aquatica TaxID=217141 RepID=A0ABU5QTA9_9BACT|nr:type III-B CRISPR module-associated Cmr3 family protein [Arcicella aquatica]MEA5260332.1 type III-B CRISPR module-associated Cmr3 family protein [Arcicella aquatica]